VNTMKSNHPAMEEWTISQIQALMKSGELTSRELTRLYLERIELIDRAGPCLNSVIEVNPEAPTIAQALDNERKVNGPRGALHGIPILIKDNIDTADRMTTASGSLALEGSIAPHDAFLVQKLRQAGAVLLGKANLSEWANFRSNHSISGWSSRGGLTRNPYALDRNPCGSSSGSAAAVAANLCSVAVGTETDGSVICPSHTNGIVGIKPTLGLVSRSGIIPIAHSQDTAGPMARTVADAAILLGVMAGIDPRDPATASSPAKIDTDYTSYLKPDAMKGARLGVARKLFGFNTRVDQIMESCLKLMQQLGAELIDPIELEEKFGETEIEVLLYEFKADLNSYLAGLGPNARVHSLKEIIAFNEQNAERVMPYFGQERMIQAEAKGPLTEPAYIKALETNHRLARDEGIDAMLRKYRLDAIVAPSGGPAWLTDLINTDTYSGGGVSSPAVAGYPHITVPAGNIFGLPVGISFFAGAYQEPVLISLAYAFEQARAARQPPRFLPTISI
jgi:amidase